MNAAAGSCGLSFEDLRFRLRTIQNDVANALTVLEELAVGVRTSDAPAEKPSCPKVMLAEDVMEHFTHKSYSDLNQGVASGRYPPSRTEPGKRREWRREDWEIWKAGEKKL